MDYLSPSFYAHVLNGILLFIALIIMVLNYSRLTRLEAYPGRTAYLILLLLLLSIAVGVHGMSHLGLEYVYGFNPMNYFNQRRL
jgi:nitrate reductase gamma subunit